MMGDVAATSDEIARMDFGYTAAKLVAFVMTAWLAGRFTLGSSLFAATITMTVASGLAAATHDLNTLFGLRLFQGFAGGVILVSAQSLLLTSFPRPSQPLIQSIFALAAVVAPATLVPYMHGWLLDTHSWAWIFLTIVPIGLTVLALLFVGSSFVGSSPMKEVSQSAEMHWPSFALFMIAISSLTYVLN